MKTSFAPVFLAAALVAGAHAQAQTVATVPVGVMTYTLPATNALTSTYLSVPLIEESAFSGIPTSVGTNNLGFTGTPFASGAFSQPGSPFFLKVLSGPQTGRMMLITANTANTVNVDTTDNSIQTTDLNLSGFAIGSSVDRIQIVPGDTLASFLGDNSQSNPVMIVGAASALSADTVSIYNKLTGKQDVYFFSTALGHWRLSTSTANQNNVVLRSESGFALTRRANRPGLTFTVLGIVPEVSSKIKTTGNTSVVYGATTYPVDMTLAQMNLQNWIKSNSALVADTVSIYNPATAKFDVYFQRTDNTWRRVGDATTDQSALSVKAGTSFALLKRSPVSGSASFVEVAMPYNLNN